MAEMTSHLLVQQVTSPRGVTFVFNPSMGTKQDPGIENLQTDLLVLTQMSGSHMSHGMQKIDERLSGELSSAMKEAGFAGHAGESVLVDCRKIENACQKFILVVGLGDLAHFKGYSVCGLMRRTLEVAKEHSVAKLTLPVFPNRQTEAVLNLAGSGAIIACRVATFGELPDLKEIEFFCTPQARRHLQKGLFAHVPHCMACANPELGKF